MREYDSVNQLMSNYGQRSVKFLSFIIAVLLIIRKMKLSLIPLMLGGYANIN